MYKEITYDKSQRGFGLCVTNPSTGTRALCGIWKTREAAHRVGQYRLHVLKSVKNPRVVRWTEKVYDKYDYVFEK